jgi:hypothetical protein
MGRPLGRRNKTTLFGKKWAGEAIAQAKLVLQLRLDEGDLAAAQFVVRHFCPKPRGGLVTLDLPQIKTAADLLQAQNTVLQAVARGEIATGDGQALMSMIMQIAKTLRLVAEDEVVAEEEHQALPDREPPPIDLTPFTVLKVPPDAMPSPLAESPPIERDQTLPVPLGGGLVVAPALREGEAVVDAHVDLELARAA